MYKICRLKKKVMKERKKIKERNERRGRKK